MMKYFMNLISMIPMILNLQLHADAGSLTNTTQGTVDAYAGSSATYANTGKMTPTMKTYYDTELLDNTREKAIFQQLGKKQPLPANHGRTVEWRKWDTLPDVTALKEGVIPTGQALGMTSQTVALTQYGEYVTVSDLLDLHAIDDTILGATEELGYAASISYDKLIRAVLCTGTNVMFADALTAAGAYDSTPATRSALVTALTNSKTCNLTSDVINKAVTKMRKANVPFYSGNDYLCVIHPSLAYDLRKDPDWIEAHKYAAPEEIFNGEIGKLHGVRFVESTLAPVTKKDGSSDLSKAVYFALFFGKDAFGVVDPAGGGMETIIKSREEVGGPLNQFSTIGTKFEMAAKILYDERVLRVECTSSYSGDDAANID